MTGSRMSRADRGAATLETTGVTIVAAVLALALLTVAAPQSSNLGATYRYWICTVVTFGQGSCTPPGAPPSAADRAPTEPCVLASNGVERNQKLAVIVVTSEDGMRIQIEELSDGTYRVTTTDTEGVGLEVGVGGGLSLTVNDVTVGGAATAQAGVSLDIANGQVYHSDADGMPALMDALMQDQVKDAVVGGDGPLRWAVDGVGGLVGVGTDLPTADAVFSQGGISLNASAEATLLAESGSAGVSGSQVLGTRLAKDGTITVYLKNSVEGSVGLQSLGVDTGPLVAGGSLEGSLDLIHAVTFDANGSMTSVQTTTVASGSSAGMANALFGGGATTDLTETQGSATVFQATLETDTEANRDVANRYLLGVGVSTLGAWVNPAASATTTVLGSLASADLMAAARDNGTVTQQGYDTDANTVFAVDASGKYVVELGVSASVREDSMTTTGAQYWDGTAWADWEACS